MTIHKAADFVEVYRAKARARDINELTGRTGRPELTRFVVAEMLAQLELHADTVIVDIGCGDALLLQQAARRGVDGYRGRLIGILPTAEEVTRVREHLLQTKSMPSELIAIERGLLGDSGMPDDYADVVVSNGTLLLLPDEAAVDAALADIARMTKRGSGVVFIGELPDSDEMAGKTYGDSVLAWLVWLLRNQGFTRFGSALLQVTRSILSNEPFVIAPKRIYHIAPERFLAKLQAAGLDILRYARHRELDAEGRVRDSRTRWNFLARRRLG